MGSYKIIFVLFMARYHNVLRKKVINAYLFYRVNPVKLIQYQNSVILNFLGKQSQFEIEKKWEFIEF